MTKFKLKLPQLRAKIGPQIKTIHKKPYSDSEVIRNYIRNKRGLKMLNVGCGTDYKKGWVNIDNNSDDNILKLDVHWDMRNPLPIDDNSVDFIFNEHFVEHLTPEQARVALTDLIRILKPGGVMRVAMPDLREVVDYYLNVPLDKNQVIIDHGLDFIQSQAEWMNVSFRDWGHQWLYDYDEIARRFKEIGYPVIQRKQLRKSKYPELNNLETRNGSTLIVEFKK
ncbi:MAG: methyltransferase domain-containing protein [Candidatus Microsaccharimonas sp.]